MPQFFFNRFFLTCAIFFLLMLLAGPVHSLASVSALGRDANQAVDGSTVPTPIPTETPNGTVPTPPDVIITEFLADNENSLRDEDGDRSDWLEIHNIGEQTVNLENWALTDRADDLKRWLFPAVSLPKEEYLVIFASDKDRSLVGHELHTNFKLRRKGEYLAIVRPSGEIAASFSPEFPTQYPDISYGVDAEGVERYFSLATPGSNNNIPGNLGPRMVEVLHTPVQPTEREPLVVSAVVAPGNADVDGVLLTYRIMYGAEATVSMEPSGSDADGHLIYQAVIPTSAYQAGDMVRYYALAVDVDGNDTRWPGFPSPLNSPEYLGTMVHDPAIESRLTILNWFSQDISAAESTTGTRATVFYAGQLYDNILVRPRGNPVNNLEKKSFKFVFNDGYHLRLPSSHLVDELNLTTNPYDPSYVRQILAWEVFRDAGSPFSLAMPMHIRRNGEFYGLLTFIEQPERSYFERQDLDWEGSLYKISGNDLSTDTKNVEKKTRTDEDDSDLQALIDGLKLSGSAREAFLFDNVNIPAALNYLAVNVIIEDWDHIVKNHYLYRDTRGTGEWMFIAWDKDLAFWGDGHERNSHPLHGSRAYPAIYVESDYEIWNHLIDALLTTPSVKEMYVRRLRTLMDQLLQPDSTPVDQRYFESRIDELVFHMEDDVDRDLARWSITASSSEAIESLKLGSIEPRRAYLYGVHAAEGGLIPSSQDSPTQIKFAEVIFASGGESPDGAYLVLHNYADVAVDISGWTLSGDIEFTFQPGVVMSPKSNLYVAKDVAAFRNRTTSPHRGEGRFIQGGYDGSFAVEFGSMLLRDRTGDLRDRISYRYPGGAPMTEIYLPMIP